jgi:hypothetical protein
MSALENFVRMWLSDISHFSSLVVKRPLRNYQLAPARAIVDSVLHHKGLEFAVMFPRQSGKNETQGQVEAYLLNLFQRVPGAQIVKAQPGMNPQGQNALTRLKRSLDNDWNRDQWHMGRDREVWLGKAVITFFSASPEAKTVGATASLLLECDEAQDVLEAEWEKNFMPMAASTNATVVYWGTAWTRRTLLAKAMRHLRQLEKADGVQRVFVVTCDQVVAENPEYGEHLARQVAKLGRQHPLVRTQYFNEEIEAEGGMFPPARRALMLGTHPRQEQPPWEVGGQRSEVGGTVRHLTSDIYALLLDVAGEDEGAIGDRTDSMALENPKRDATVLTIVEVDLSTLSDPILRAPTYRVVDRRIWVGVQHAKLYGQIRALAKTWRARYLVGDATGVGAGLVSFLAKALGEDVVIPFEFNSASKSDLGWDFLGICDSGRFQEWRSEVGSQKSDEDPSDLRHLTSDVSQETFRREVEFCQYEVLPGPGKLLRWGVPDGTRDPATAELVHDDALLSAALVAVLDEQPWAADTGPGTIFHADDPLDEMSEGF